MKPFSTTILFFVIAVFFKIHSATGQCINYGGAILTGGTYCSDTPSSTVTITNTTIGTTYQAFLGNQAVGSAVVSTGGNINLAIPTTSLSIGKNVIRLRPEAAVCPANILPADTALVVINALPDNNLIVVGDTICIGELTAYVKIFNTQKGVSYTINLNNIIISPPFLSNGGDVTIAIPTTNLVVGRNVVSVTAMIQGCQNVVLVNPALILVNSQPMISMTPIPDQVLCEGTDTKIVLKNTSSGATFQVFLRDVPLGPPFVSDGKDVEIMIQAEKLAIGDNKVTVKATIVGPCATVLLTTTSNIRVNPSIQFNFEVTGDTVTMEEEYATLTIKPAVIGVKYSVFENTVLIEELISSSNTIVHKFPVGNGVGELAVGTHTIRVIATIYGCNQVTLSKNATIVVKPSTITSLYTTTPESFFNVWPNPIVSDLHINMKTSGGTTLINIVNSIGAKVFEQEFASSQELIIRPELTNGVYFMEISSGNSKERIKLIK